MGIFTPFTWNNLPQIGLRRDVFDVARTTIVSLAEAKAHLRILHSDDDTYITSIINAAQLTAEYYCNNDFTPCQWTFTCDLWNQTMKLPHGQWFKIQKISYYDDNGSLQTWASTEYIVDLDTMPNRITLRENKTYPSLRDGVANIFINMTSVGDEFDNGYTQVAKQAVLIMLTDMYENRQSVVVGRIASSIPKTSQYLLDTLKIQTL
tara:strand:- start:1877 stop:2497 length:621 start_codon:yes stop_codon:yes gene_type:complete